MPLYDLWGASNVDIEIAKDIFPSDEWLSEKNELFDHPEHGWFESTYQKKRLHYRKNVPNCKLKAIVVWAHGICGQSGFGMKIGDRYTDQALRIRQMGEAGIAVYSFDMLGHGFSEGGRFYIPNGRWEINRDDLVRFCKLAAKDHDVPLFVSGDSYGGCLALHAAHYFQTHPDECPVLVLRYALAPFFPKTTPFFMPHPITSERIWQEPEARAYFSNHEEMHGLSRGGEPFCLVTAVGLLASLQEAQKVCHEFDLPFHISHGDCDYGVPLSGSQHLYDNCKTPDEKKSLNIIKGGYHAFFSRPDASDILGHEIRWMEQIIREHASSK